MRYLAALLCCICLMGMSRVPDTPLNGSFEELSFEVIAKWEGKRNEAYLDRIARPPVWTICYGHTETAHGGMVKTDDECRSLLVQEIRKYRDKLMPYFTSATIATRLPVKRMVAYVSLAYNVGWYGAGRSTAVKRLNAGDIAGGCSALTWWNKAGGRVIRGLINRRADEYMLCMEGL